MDTASIGVYRRSSAASSIASLPEWDIASGRGRGSQSVCQRLTCCTPNVRDKRGHALQAYIFLFDWVAANLTGNVWANVPVDYFTRLPFTAAYSVAMTVMLPLCMYSLLHYVSCARAATRNGVRVGVLILLVSGCGVCVSSCHKYLFEGIASALRLGSDASLKRVAFQGVLALLLTAAAVAVQVLGFRYIQNHPRPNRFPGVWIVRSLVVSFWSTLGWQWTNFVSMGINNRVIDIDGLLSMTIIAVTLTVVWLPLIRWVIPSARRCDTLLRQRVLVTLRMLSVDMIGRSWIDWLVFLCTSKLPLWIPHEGVAAVGYGIVCVAGVVLVALTMRYAKHVSYKPRGSWPAFKMLFAMYTSALTLGYGWSQTIDALLDLIPVNGSSALSPRRMPCMPVCVGVRCAHHAGCCWAYVAAGTSLVAGEVQAAVNVVVAAIITAIAALLFAVVLRMASGVPVKGVSAVDLIHPQYAEPGEGPSADSLVACLMEAPSLFDVKQVHSFHGEAARDTPASGLGKPLLGSDGSASATASRQASPVGGAAPDAEAAHRCACNREVELQADTNAPSPTDSNGPAPPHRVALRKAVAIAGARLAASTDTRSVGADAATEPEHAGTPPK